MGDVGKPSYVEPDTWHVRGPDTVVHWHGANYLEPSTKTRCDCSLAWLFDINSSSAWSTQFAFVDDDVTCIGCLAAGPHPPDPPEHDDSYYPDDDDFPRI